jgi:hypothetical protein
MGVRSKELGSCRVMLANPDTSGTCRIKLPSGD